MNDRTKKLYLNTVSSLIYQIVTVICGFILPRLILQSYGSEVNGLVNSINQFLTVIAFLELGVGAVVQSALYKPLVEKDNIQISKIVSSANKFFSKIATVLLIYVIGLLIIYPSFVQESFGRWYVDYLILAISITSFAQYYFGVVNTLLITADQRGYIQYFINTVTLILNNIFCVFLIKQGASIQFVKLTTSVIYLIRPALLRLFVNKNYTLDRKIKYEGEPIAQKWNGIAQHVAAIVLDQTDIIVLTMFSTLSNVSIYSVYHLVVYNIKNLFLSMTNGFRSLMGELIAKDEIEELNKLFNYTEWILHTGTTFVFGCTALLIVPFVSIYTKGITDTNYIVPSFAYLITLANAIHCLRLPYNTLILAAGHYKQTQRNYIIAASMNIILSIITVKMYGLIGVAIGTLCAMLYQTVWMAIYDSNNIIYRPISYFVKHVVVDILTIVICVFLTKNLVYYPDSYLLWIIMSVKVAIVFMFIVIIINLLLYKEMIFKLFRVKQKN